jgi:hypothetical protein
LIRSLGAILDPLSDPVAVVVFVGNASTVAVTTGVLIEVDDASMVGVGSASWAYTLDPNTNKVRRTLLTRNKPAVILNFMWQFLPS